MSSGFDLGTSGYEEKGWHLTMGIYGLVIFPKALGHAKEDLSDVNNSLVWFHHHFWKVEKVSYRVFFEDYSPLKEFVAIQRQDNISEEKWMAIL
ncbi:hypothetical protein PVK06_002268 [Gossypium arboreum]|uniref:Uncharacterized protein n=1 Tax=Gossypium arboreum TaxID=29729 RepID=A0ABR0R4A7_GOSAR|nr:hypothetical protein PVK06_002268 [Gossypium arboreum]